MGTEFDPKVDYYAVLGVDDNATTADIKKAHRTRIAEIHPDRGGEPAHAAAVNVARDVLSKPSTRRAYDEARRRWFLQALESPFVRAFLDPDGKITAHFAAQGGAAPSPHGRADGAPQNTDPVASSARPGSSAEGPTRPQAPAANPRRRPAAGVSRLRERFAERRARAASQASAEAPVSHGNPTSSPTESSDPPWWKWGELTEAAWRDACNILESGDWLGAAGMFGTALFIDRFIYANADAAARAKTDAVVAAGKQERAMAFIEMIAGAVGTYFGLNRAEVEARAGAAARKAASTTSRAAVARRPGKRKRVVRRTSDR